MNASRQMSTNKDKDKQQHSVKEVEKNDTIDFVKVKLFTKCV